MKTVIMAGGRGTRISKLFPEIPKPLIPIKDKHGVKRPVLEWEIRSLVAQGFTEIILTVSHMADKIEAYFGTGEQIGAKITYFREDKPYGNAGALFKMREELDAPFLLLNADSVFDIDFNRFVAYHRASGALVTLFTHPNNHPYDSGLIVAEDDKSVRTWLTKENVRPEWYKNRVNAGLHVIDPAVLDMTLQRTGLDPNKIGNEDPMTGKVIRVDLDRQILQPLCNTGKMFCYDSPEYVKDMGTPERYEQVSRDFKNGVVADRNLTHKQRAVFLDRDGTINRYVGFLRDIEGFELLPGVAEAIKRINNSGYLAIVVTNQPVIARGEVTFLELELIHKKMETMLGAEGAYVDGLYFCPHHPDKGFEGEVSELKIDCDCRKPKPGLLFRAAQDFNIDLSNSWMIGDGKNDVQAGQNAGCRTALIGTDDYGQNIMAKSLLAAIDIILGKV